MAVTIERLPNGVLEIEITEHPGRNLANIAGLAAFFGALLYWEMASAQPAPPKMLTA